MGGHHSAVLILIKHYTQLIQPFDGVGSLHNQTAQKLRPCRKMSAAEGIQIMSLRRIILLIRRLDAALRHHGIGVTDTKLRHHHHIGACLVSLDSRRGTGSADDQHIHIISRMIQINGNILDPAVGVK